MKMEVLLPAMKNGRIISFWEQVRSTLPWYRRIFWANPPSWWPR